MIKRFVPFFVLLVAIIALGVYFYKRPGVEKSEVYAFIPAVDNPFWLDVRNGLEEEAAKNPEFDVRILTANTTDAANQVEQLRGVLDRGRVDAIVFGPTNNRAPAPIIASYNRAGIPVVMIDTELDEGAAKSAGARWDVFIGSDNRLGGKLAAEAMAEAIETPSDGKPTVLLLKGSYVHQSAIDRAEGFIAGSEDRFELLERDGEWSRQRAIELTSSVISRQKLDGIFASNDEMALGAVAALQELAVDKSEWPIIIGFDATGPAQQAISNDLMFASVRQLPKDMGAAGLSSAIDLVKNGLPDNPEKTLVPVDVLKKADIADE